MAEPQDQPTIIIRLNMINLPGVANQYPDLILQIIQYGQQFNEPFSIQKLNIDAEVAIITLLYVDQPLFLTLSYSIPQTSNS